MRGHLLLRPHVCDVLNHYSASNALKIALSIDTAYTPSCRQRHSKRTSSTQAPEETLPAAAGTSLRGQSKRSWRPNFNYALNHDADVIVHDLRATLDAHRVTNRASTIRRVDFDGTSLPFFHRPEIVETDIEDNDNATSRAIVAAQMQNQNRGVAQERRTVGCPRPLTLFPTKTMQRDRRPLRLMGKPIDDYEGVSLRPAQPWSFGHKGIERPWVDYLHDDSGDGYSRYATSIWSVGSVH